MTEVVKVWLLLKLQMNQEHLLNSIEDKQHKLLLLSKHLRPKKLQMLLQEITQTSEILSMKKLELEPVELL